MTDFEKYLENSPLSFCILLPWMCVCVCVCVFVCVCMHLVECVFVWDSMHMGEISVRFWNNLSTWYFVSFFHLFGVKRGRKTDRRTVRQKDRTINPVYILPRFRWQGLTKKCKNRKIIMHYKHPPRKSYKSILTENRVNRHLPKEKDLYHYIIPITSFSKQLPIHIIKSTINME